MSNAMYRLRVKSDSDSDLQPTIASLESEMVIEVWGVDTDEVRVKLASSSDCAAYEALLDADDDVLAWEAL